MSSSSCTYDCSIHPTAVTPYSDISGIGVVLGYVLTAGIAVFIITAYYFISYQPEVDPFQRSEDANQDSDSASFTPNPIDKHLLKSCRWLWRGMVPRGRRAKRVEKSLIKCILNMSDLQIVTGISILISGYAQLRCGISTYHWQVMVWLAWFSSLTHMACLTFLRNYLYTHPSERLWRLFGMLSIAGLLFVAMLPTFNFNLLQYNDKTMHPTPADQTICYFRPGNTSSGHRGGERAVASMILLIVGFLFRAVRLHKSVSLGTLAKLRRKLSKYATQKLESMYNWCDTENSPLSPKRTLLYWPTLASRLSIKVLWDFLTSMYFEVLFLAFGFGWAVGQLVQVLRVANGGNSQWNFGQVVPVVVLATPLISVTEYFFPEEVEEEGYQKKQEVHIVVQKPAALVLPTTEPDQPLHSTQSSIQTYNVGIKDNPRCDFYEKKHFAAATILLPLLIAMLAVTTVGQGQLITWRVITFNICLAPVYFSTFIIISFYMEYLSQKFPKARVFLMLFPFLAFSPFIIEAFPQITALAYGFSLILVIPLIILYVLWCFIHWGAFHLERNWRRRMNPNLTSKSNISDQPSSEPPSDESH